MTERDHLREAARLVLEAYDKPGDKEGMWAPMTVLRAVLGDDKPKPTPDPFDLPGFWPAVAVSDGHVPVTTERVRHRSDFIYGTCLCGVIHTEDYAASAAADSLCERIIGSSRDAMRRLFALQLMIWYGRKKPTSWVILSVRTATDTDIERVARVHRRNTHWPPPEV